MQPASHSQSSPDEEHAWACLRALAARAASGRHLNDCAGLALDARGEVCTVPSARSWIALEPELPNGWSSPRPLSPYAAQLLDQFVPLCSSPRLVVGHLGQSADGHVATFQPGDKFITGAEDIRHTHRMRALFDAVLVGASTIEIDDPLLTTRVVEGPSPVRVVLDPNARLPDHHQVFREGAARTLVVSDRARGSQLPNHVEQLTLRRRAHGFDMHELLQSLAARGLGRVFVEGGEITINHFLRARALDRLQIAVAPQRLGEGPRPVPLHLTPLALAHLGPVRRFMLGSDILFEAELRKPCA